MLSEIKRNNAGIVGYLNNLASGIFSIVSTNGKPYAFAVYFIVDYSYNVYFITKAETKKSQFISTNNNAALTTIDPELPRTIQATGVIEEVSDTDVYSTMIQKLSETIKRKNKNFWPPPVARIKMGKSIIMYKFIPNWMRIGDFSQKASVEGLNYVLENVFHQVIPEEK